MNNNKLMFQYYLNNNIEPTPKNMKGKYIDALFVEWLK